MELPIFQVDAFTDRLFGGNPAAVVLVSQWLPDEILQAIAAENHLAETAFVLPLQGEFGLRWFTPAVEIDLCGHAFRTCDWQGASGLVDRFLESYDLPQAPTTGGTRVEE